MVWLAITCVCISVIAQVTHVVQRRAFVQESADAIALAAVIGGAHTAHQLEQRLRVTITQLVVTEEEVSVRVQMGEYLATSSASRGG